MILCSACGNENRLEARFCRYCGFPLDTIEASALKNFQEEKLPASPDQTVSLGIISEEAPPVNDPAKSAEIIRDDGFLLPGHVLKNRYQIRQVLETSADDVIYEAEDLLSCWSCQELNTSTENQFCENCGAELLIKPLVKIRAVRLEPLNDTYTDDGSLVEGEYKYEVLPNALPETITIAPPIVHLESGFKSLPGGVRENNEDSLVVFHLNSLCENGCPRTVGLFAVADGVGGSEGGEVASKAAIEGLAAYILKMIFLPVLQGELPSGDDLIEEMKQAFQAGNQAILDLHNQLANQEMGCTLTAALIYESNAVIANVGDSRTYLMRDKHLARITQDHSLVARMVEQGVLQDDEVYSHQHRNVILRSLGFQSELEVDIYKLDLIPGDRLLLCSDGLWETLRDPMLEEILLEQMGAQQACDRLADLAAAGDDNISLVVVNVQA